MTQTEKMQAQRKRLKGEVTHWDLIVIGGGITGAGILREAVRAGLKALLVEQRDFAWGTSSRSSKLVHGGLRYLKEGNLLLTRASLHERERLLKESQGLVQRLNFLISNYVGEKPGRWTFSAGLAIYDLLAQHWDHEYFSAEAMHFLSPHLKTDRLKGGLRYTDAQVDDSRLVMRVLQEAQQGGAVALNDVRASEVLRRDGKVVGLSLLDRRDDVSFEAHAPLVINATGAWADKLRDIELSKIRPLRGSHLTFPAWRFPMPQAMTVLHPKDRRPVFALPWEGATIFGTTDVDHSSDLNAEPRISEAETLYLMECLTERFPSLNLKLEDVVSTWAGVRPVISSGKADPSKESRDHLVLDEHGLLTVTGGKLTTFRKMAFDVLQKAAEYLPKGVRFDKQSPVFAEARLGRLPDQVDAVLAQRLLGRYGQATETLMTEAAPEDLTWIPGTLHAWAELPWAMQHEQVQQLDDLLLRRTRLGLLLPEGGLQHIDRIRCICEPVCDWDADRWQTEIDAYRELWQQAYSLPPALLPKKHSKGTCHV
jgi:glycerol-3-phosphate dehydrogenase